MNGYPSVIIYNSSNLSSTNPLPVVLQSSSGNGTPPSVSIYYNNSPLSQYNNPLPVSLGSNSINISNVQFNTSSTVTVASTADNPVHVHDEQQIATGSNIIGAVYLSNAIPPGKNIIGAMYLSNAIPTGANTIGSVGLNTGTNIIGAVYMSNAIPAGANTIGSVGLNAGTNVIGAVYMSNALPTGANTIGSVGLNAGTNIIGSVYMSNAIPTGTNIIGAVYMSNAIPAGANTIGSVGINYNSYSNYIGNVGIVSPVLLPVNLTAQIPTGSNTIGNVNIMVKNAQTTAYNPMPVYISSSSDAIVADAFGRIRVSQTFTLGDYKHLYGLDGNFTNYSNNGATISYNRNQACAILSTSNLSSTANAIHQTYMYHNYQPGKSHLILSSFCFGAYTSNVIKRAGYFDNNNGLFFQQDGTQSGQLSFNIRSYVTGTPVDTKYVQSSWNVDTFDGSQSASNPSGIALNISNVQLFYSDFQWLGVGRIRFGFTHGGVYILAHQVNIANNQPVVWMSSPNLPIRCQIMTSNGIPPNAGGSFNQICSTVMSEGGYIETGIDFGFFMTAGIAVNNNTSAAILALKMAPTFGGYSNNVYARLIKASIFTTTSDVAYSIVRVSESSITGGTWFNIDAGSACMINSNVTLASGTSISYSLTNGYVSATSGGSAYSSVATTDASDAKRNFIAQDYTGTNSLCYVVYINNSGIGTGGNAVTYVALQWREVY